MQSIFRLPWCSEQIAPKMSETVALEKMRPAAVVEIPVWNKLKRKRTDSLGDAVQARVQTQKKERPLESVASCLPYDGYRISQSCRSGLQTPVRAQSPPSKASTEPQPQLSAPQLPAHLSQASEPPCDNDSRRAMTSIDDAHVADAHNTVTSSKYTRLQQVIETEFNMQILMKHNELRLIEQELAKCQVALEQLRRAELRPYPGHDRPVASVSSGVGSSVLPSSGYSKPTHAAPYGVTDGPYTRHYSQWLLHDPIFESEPMQPIYSAEMYAQAAGRSTRNSGSARKSVSKPFAFTSGPSATLQSISNYPSLPAKDKSAPLVLKRSTDNQFVKLICNNCLRGNFSSIQGFLNHCRIAHKVDYKSHDAAAIDCGRVLDEAEAANLPIEVQNTPAPKPSVSRISTASSTPFKNLVHPLITGASSTAASSGRDQKAASSRKPAASLAVKESSFAHRPLATSSSVPRLSAQFTKHSMGGDLAAAVAGAKQHVDFGHEDDVLSPDQSEQNSPLEPLSHSSTVSGNGRASMMSMPGGGQPTSNKGIRQHGRQPRPSPLAPITSHGIRSNEESSEILESPDSHSLYLSPHTADSNPGLVSDHEDDDHGSVVSEEDAPQAESPRPAFNAASRNCEENVEVVMTEEEHLDGDRVVIRFGDEERGLSAAATPSRGFPVGKRGS